MAKRTPRNWNYEAAVSRVEEIIRSIEDEEIGVDELASVVKEGVGLIKQCQEVLKSTQTEVTELLASLEDAAGDEDEESD